MTPKAIDWRSLSTRALMDAPPMGRVEQIMEWLHPPLYCECGCGKVVGEGKPLISKELAKRLLDATP